LHLHRKALLAAYLLQVSSLNQVAYPLQAVYPLPVSYLLQAFSLIRVALLHLSQLYQVVHRDPR
jgi:hypothetical protein